VFDIPKSSNRICDECKGLAILGIQLMRNKSENALCRDCSNELFIELRRELNRGLETKK
jgi:hypothetical protein